MKPMESLRLVWLGLTRLSLRSFAFLLALMMATADVQWGAESGHSNFLPLDQVKAGMKGMGRTVFQGDQIEEFEVEILGVLENIAPKQSAILAKLSGGPLEKTGVMGGMSGSPVYVEGKVVGAVAFSFPFSKEAIAGITPIEQMVSLFDTPPEPVKVDPIRIDVSTVAPHRTVMIKPSVDVDFLSPISSKRFAVNVSDATSNVSLSRLAGQTFSYIDTPFVLSGFHPRVAEAFAKALQNVGITPVQVGGAPVPSSSGTQLADGSDIVPGSALAVQLIRGDLGVGASAAGTVTYREGDKIYAFGHPWLSVGPTGLPFSKAKVLSLIPNLNNSFKIAVPTDLAGSITQDRSQGLFGTVGVMPKLIPLTINLKSSRNKLQTYRFELVNDRFLTPLLTNFTIFNTITSNERALGESTLQVQGKISIKGQEDVKIENLFSGEANSQAFASLAVVQPLTYLMASGFNEVDVEEIKVDITSIDEKRTVTLDRVWADRAEIKPGETVILSAFLRAAGGEEHVERIPIEIPAETPGGPLLMTVADGSTLTAVENRVLRQSFTPRNLDQLIRAINNIRKNDRVYVRLQRLDPSVIIRGEELSSLPPSFSAVVTSDRSSSTSLTTLRSSNLYEYELPSTPFVITGQRSLTIEVVD
ncbi:MAG: SpoIVB peptidase S55 domain-containing protein [Acidobacteriota bacterium]